ncbi:MAG: type II toxin-antitoxin system RelE/ParE family toxin [Alphaproteobacteria bacterium]|nr:type II toxin-antitoxin system RelE/ParE family toxin [Alphaproteobacteria bacterium]
MKLRWTGKAEEDLTAQCDHVASVNPALAERIGSEVLARVAALAMHPFRGRAGRVDGTRELPLPGLPWLAVYAVEGDCVVILRLLHGAQAWPQEVAE